MCGPDGRERQKRKEGRKARTLDEINERDRRGNRKDKIPFALLSK